MTATAKGVAEWAPTLGTTYFDRDGDLRLEVGPDNIECVVCPRALSRASPVFKNMLYGGFKESKPSKGEWVVKLPEDDPQALFLVLHIVHGQYDKVPKTLPEQKLYAVTVLTDKYDLTSSLRPWATHWLEHLKGTTRDTGLDTVAWRIWIAWELGDANLFKAQAESLLLSCGSGLSTLRLRSPSTFRTLETLGLVGMAQCSQLSDCSDERFRT
jgi:hypothetical protein